MKGLVMPGIIIVLGYKLEPDGSMNPRFVANLDQAVRCWKADQMSKIVVTGGQTRAEYPSEAEVAGEYLVAHGVPRRSILLETEARATADHPRLVKALLQNVRMDTVQIITHPPHIRRSRLIFRRLWPEIIAITTWVPSPAPVTALDIVKEWILVLVFWVDPDSRWLMPWLTKKHRNSKA